jgi:hypothetical protein
MNLCDVSQVSALLEAERARFESKSTRDWIERHAGPLPAADMPRRVLDVIESMVIERRSHARQPS